MTRRLLALAVLLGVLARAQVPVVLEFPEGSALELSAAEVTFDLARLGYPPQQLPAHYPPTAPGEPPVLRLFSNLEGAWALEAELSDLATPDGDWLPADRVEVRLNGGPWLPLGSPVRLWLGEGPTRGYREGVLEFRLRVVGDERPGRYRGVLVLRLLRL